MIGTDRRGNLLLGLDLEVQRQRTEAELVGQRGRRLSGEVTGDLSLAVGDDRVHRRRGDNRAVEDDREGVTVGAPLVERRTLGIRGVVAVEDRGRVLELLRTRVVELQGHGPLAGRLTVVVACETGGCGLQIRTGHGHGTEDVLDLTGLVTCGVGLVGGTLNVLDVGGSRAVERQEVVHDLLGDPREIRSVLGRGCGSVGQDAVLIRVSDTLRGRLIQCGGLNARLGCLGGRCTRLGRLGGRSARLLARLGTGLGPRLRRIRLGGLLVLDDALSCADTQDGAEVHLRGRTNKIQLLLRGCAGDRHHDVRAAHRGDLRLGHAGGVDSVADNRDRLGDVLFGDLTLSIARHGRRQDELSAALQVKGQVGIRGHALHEVPDRKCRARRHDGDGQGHERAHGASLV